eukprot:scaffold118914_cov69-Phaeocystis_antarctica.AAC.2
MLQTKTTCSTGSQSRAPNPRQRAHTLKHAAGAGERIQAHCLIAAAPSAASRLSPRRRRPPPAPAPRRPA